MILVRRKPIAAGVVLAAVVLCGALLVHAWTDSGRVVVTLPGAPTAHVAQLSPGRIALAVRNYGLVVVNLADDITSRVDPHAVGSTFRQTEPLLAVDALHQHVLVGSEEPPCIVAVDARGVLVFSIPVSGRLDSMAIAPSTGRLYAAVRAASGAGDDLLTFDGVTGARLRSTHLGAQADALALDEHTGHIFAIDNASGIVTTVDYRTGKVLHRTAALVPFGLAPAGVVVDATTSRLFIRDSDSDRNTSHVRVFDTGNGRLLTTVALKGQPCIDHGCRTNLPLLLDAVSGHVVVANDDGSVSRLDGHTGHLDRTDTLQAGHPSYGIISMVMDVRTGRVYASLGRRQGAERSAPGPGLLCRIDGGARFQHVACAADTAQTLLAVDPRHGHALVLRTFSAAPRYDLLGWLRAGARALLRLPAATSATQRDSLKSTIMTVTIGS